MWEWVGNRNDGDEVTRRQYNRYTRLLQVLGPMGTKMRMSSIGHINKPERLQRIINLF